MGQHPFLPNLRGAALPEAAVQRAHSAQAAREGCLQLGCGLGPKSMLASEAAGQGQGCDGSGLPPVSSPCFPTVEARAGNRDRDKGNVGSLQPPLPSSPWHPPPTTSPLMPSQFGSIVSSLSVHLIGSVGPSGYETEGSTADNGLGGGGPGASTEPERPWPGRGEGSEKRGLKPDRGPRAGQGRAGQV